MVKRIRKPEKEKEKPPKHSDGVVGDLWIAPDLAEKMRGHDGSRGLEDVHPTNYIKIADVALRTPAGEPEKEPDAATPSYGGRPSEQAESASVESIPRPRSAVAQLRSPAASYTAAPCAVLF